MAQSQPRAAAPGGTDHRRRRRAIGGRRRTAQPLGPHRASGVIVNSVLCSRAFIDPPGPVGEGVRARQIPSLKYSDNTEKARRVPSKGPLSVRLRASGWSQEPVRSPPRESRGRLGRSRCRQVPARSRQLGEGLDRRATLSLSGYSRTVTHDPTTGETFGVRISPLQQRRFSVDERSTQTR
jgi:hypothetical protein